MIPPVDSPPGEWPGPWTHAKREGAWRVLDTDPHAFHSLDVDAASTAWVFATWYSSRRERLQPAASSAARALATSLSPALQEWLAYWLMVLTPDDFGWQVMWLHDGARAPLVAARCRFSKYVLSHDLDTRLGALQRLGRSGYFRDPPELRLLLTDGLLAVRTLAVELLSNASEETRDALAPTLVTALQKETSAPLRRKLSRLLPAPTLPAPRGLTGEELEAAWATPSRRPTLRNQLAELACEPSGLVVLAALSRFARADGLRVHCNEVLLVSAEPLDVRLDEALAATVSSSMTPLAARFWRAHLEDAMRSRRTLRAAHARALAGHGALIVRHGAEPAYVSSRDGDFAADGRALATESERSVAIVHPVLLQHAERASLRGVLAAHRLAQPIEQLDRQTHELPAHCHDAEYLDLPAQHRAFGPWLAARGWAPGTPEPESESDGQWVQCWREFPEANLEAECLWRGIPQGPRWGDPANAGDVAPTLAFRGRGGTLRLGQVPAALLSESLRDLLVPTKPARQRKKSAPLDGFERLFALTLLLEDTHELRADVSAVVERLGDASVQALQLVGDGRVSDLKGLARALDITLPRARALALALCEAIEAALRSV